MTARVMHNCGSGKETHHSSRGQATILVLGGLAGILIAAVVIGAVARAVGKEAAAQRAADLAAVAAARVMHDNYGRLFEPAYIRRRPNPNHLEKADYLALGRAAGQRVAKANGASAAAVSFPDEATIAPVRVRVAIRETHPRSAASATGRRSRSSPRPSSAPPRTSPSRPAAATTARSPRVRANGCARTSPSPSTAWTPPPAPTASRS